MASMIEFGKPPRAVLRIEVKRGLFPLRQGADALKAMVAANQVERALMPSIGEFIHDQTGLGERESQEVIYERYKTQL